MTGDNSKKEMKTVHERDLDNLLNKLSLKDEFYSGGIKCKFCTDIISKDNIYSLLHESGSIKFICDKSECISDFMLLTESKKRNS